MAYMFGQEEKPEEKMVRDWRESHFKKRRKRRKPTVAPIPLPLSKYNSFNLYGTEEVRNNYIFFQILHLGVVEGRFTKSEHYFWLRH